MNKFLRNDINTIFIMLGSACNFQCKYCLQHPLITDQISSNINPDIIEFIKELGQNQPNPFRIQFYGGEPLLYWNNIVEIVNELKGSNCLFSIITNGGLITEDKVQFMNDNNFSCSVSWDGLNVNETRGRDVFKEEDLKNTIFKINCLGISSVMSSLNYPLSILEECKKLNDEYVQYRKDNNLSETYMYINMDEIMDTGLDHKYLTEIDCEKASSDMRILCDHYKKQFEENEEYEQYYVNFISKYVGILKHRVLNTDRKFSTCACGNGYTVLNLDLEGNLYRCHNTHIKVGTIYDNYSKYIGNVIHYDGTKEFNKKCSQCYVQDICNNGCPLIEQEIRDKYYCDMKRAIFYPVLEMIMEVGGSDNGN